MKHHGTFFSGVFLLLLVMDACAPDPAGLAKRFSQTYNTHHVKNIMTLYADNAVFGVSGKLTLAGKDTIQLLTQYDSVLNSHMVFSNIEAKGDTVFCDLAETNDWYKAAGIDEAYYSMKLVFHKGLITLLQAEQDPGTEKAVGQVLSPLMDWAYENRKKELADMMPEGKFIYNAENAKTSLALLRDWKQNVK